MGEYVNLSASSQTLAAATAHNPRRRAVGTSNVCGGEIFHSLGTCARLAVVVIENYRN